MCALDPLLTAGPMVAPVVGQVSAYAAPYVEGFRVMMKIALAGIAALLVSACGQSVPEDEEPAQVVVQPTSYPEIEKIAASEDLTWGLYHVCDRGRALYLYAERGSAVAVVENAAECKGN